jgi:hypothetical protein
MTTERETCRFAIVNEIICQQLVVCFQRLIAADICGGYFIGIITTLLCLLTSPLKALLTLGTNINHLPTSVLTGLLACPMTHVVHTVILGETGFFKTMM